MSDPPNFAERRPLQNTIFAFLSEEKKTPSFQFSTPNNKMLHVHMIVSKPGYRSAHPHSASQTTAGTETSAQEQLQLLTRWG